MKKIAAILLISILLFNWVGYQLYTAIMEQHADDTMIARLNDNNYDESALISIKVPALHLPSYATSREFERVDGKIEINGVQYNYVKRRFINDSLELLCIPNKKATQLKSAKNEFFKLVNDLQHPGQSKADQHTASFKCFNGEYYSNPDQFAIPGQTAVSLKATAHYLLQIPTIFLTRAGQPPDVA